jgi:hypothetical protein
MARRKARVHLVFHLRSQPLSLYGLDSLRSDERCGMTCAGHVERIMISCHIHRAQCAHCSVCQRWSGQFEAVRSKSPSLGVLLLLLNLASHHDVNQVSDRSALDIESMIRLGGLV